MYVCGLRISEACTLQTKHIDGQSNTIRIIGKGNKERIVPIPDKMLNQLRTYWTTHRHPIYLFPNKSGNNRIAPSGVYKAFKQALIQANLQPSATPHTLRHSYATELMMANVDLAVIQRLLGHESIKSTVIYTHLTAYTRDKVQEAIAKLMQR